MIDIYASELAKETVVDLNESKSMQSVTATITPFTLTNYRNFESYNEQFKIATSQIKSITNNGDSIHQVQLIKQLMEIYQLIGKPESRIILPLKMKLSLNLKKLNPLIV